MRHYREWTQIFDGWRATSTRCDACRFCTLERRLCEDPRAFGAVTLQPSSFADYDRMKRQPISISQFSTTWRLVPPECNRGCYKDFRRIAIAGMTAAPALSAMHPAHSRVRRALITILIPLAGAAPAWAHGAKPPAASTVVAKPAEPIELPGVDMDGYRLKGSVLQEIEIELRIDRQGARS